MTPPCTSLSKFQGSLSTLGSAPRFLRVSTCHHPVVQLLPCQAPIILIRAYLFKSECEKDELRLSSFGYLSEVLESFTLGTICLLQITCVETDRTGKEPPVIPLRCVCSCSNASNCYSSSPKSHYNLPVGTYICSQNTPGRGLLLYLFS